MFIVLVIKTKKTILNDETMMICFIRILWCCFPHHPLTKTRLEYLRDGSRVGRPRAGVDGRQAPLFKSPGVQDGVQHTPWFFMGFNIQKW